MNEHLEKSTRATPDLELERVGVEYKSAQMDATENYIQVVMDRVGKLVDFTAGPRTVLVIGCGPRPKSIRRLLALGFDAVGIEPVAESVRAAAEYLGDPSRMRLAAAEDMPFPDRSMMVVVMESVLEHVDSPLMTLSEIYRVLVPGGVLYLTTSNRHRFSITGHNPEFRPRFYNWYPRLVKECYIFHHLHHDPSLAHYSPRPAVHWFTFEDLCQLGRQVGFAHFYSRFDFDPYKSTEGEGKRSSFRQRIKNKALHLVGHHPWLKALALTQFGNIIFMVKRAA